MFASVPAFLRLTTLAQGLRSSITFEPKMIFVYLLLLLVPWVFWQGYRTGEGSPESDTTSHEVAAAGTQHSEESDSRA